MFIVISIFPYMPVTEDQHTVTSGFSVPRWDLALIINEEVIASGLKFTEGRALFARDTW